MSADNGIYIGVFPTDEDDVFEYRVAHGFDSWVESIDSYHYTPEQSREHWHEFFKDSPVFTSADDAANEAAKIEQESGWTEYGICMITMLAPWDGLRQPIEKGPYAF